VMARTANEEEKSWSERELLRALEQLRASAAESLASPTLSPNDAPLIRVALADLDGYADQLLAVLRSIDEGGGGVFDLLRPVLVAAVIIGSGIPPARSKAGSMSCSMRALCSSLARSLSQTRSSNISAVSSRRR
jgi:hypothetical protein